MVRDDADRVSVESGEPDDNIFCEVFVDFEEFSIVRDCVDYVFDVVRFLRIFGNERVERGMRAVPRVARSPLRRVVEIIRWQVAEQFANHGKAFGVIA